MQSTARRNELPLDKMCLVCDVTKKQKEDFTYVCCDRNNGLYRLICFRPMNRTAPREGAYVHGMFMEGARWDIQSGIIMESRLKELFPAMPVINVRVSVRSRNGAKWFVDPFHFNLTFRQAITQDKQDLRNMYECPVYKTRTRGPTYVWTFNLKSKDKPSKWTLAGVALLLQV